MSSLHEHCPHCNSAEAAIGVGDHLKCIECSLEFTHDGQPWRPEVCTRCGFEGITWTGDAFSCSECGRANYGCYPLKAKFTSTRPKPTGRVPNPNPPAVYDGDKREKASA